MTGSAHEFDWHAESESHSKWALTTLMHDIDFDQLADDTNHFSDVKIEIFVNGTRVNAKEYMDRLWGHVEYLAGKQATQMVEDIAPLAELANTVQEFQRTIMEQMEAFAEKNGIEFPDRDRDW